MYYHIILVSIKFGEMAIIWYWQDLNLAIGMISVIHVGVHALNLNWQV